MSFCVQHLAHSFGAVRVEVVVHRFLDVFPSQTAMERNIGSAVGRVLV